ncbi:MAG TPA: HEAT repeat domain-containing protein [Chloroflexia bacterium]|nr:HEAT repeat domain-containing protein [Chloroflexia bacterium]
MDKYIEDRLDKLESPDKRVRIAAATALGRVTKNKHLVIQPLINLLTDPDEDVSRAANRALIKLGKEAVLPLIEALKHPDPDIRYHAISPLGEIPDRSAIEPLLDLLKNDENSSVRAAAAGVVSVVLLNGHFEWDEEIEEKFNRVGEALINALKDKDSRVRADAAISSGNLHFSKAVQPLIEALKDADEDVRGHAAFALRNCGGGEIVEPLIPLLQDESDSVRIWTTGALEWTGYPETLEPLSKAVDPMIDRLKDDNPRVREYAARVLGSYLRIEGIERAVGPLIEALNDKSSAVRYAVVQALGLIGKEDVLKILEKVQANDFENTNLGYTVSEGATEAIGHLKERYPS